MGRITLVVERAVWVRARESAALQAGVANRNGHDTQSVQSKGTVQASAVKKRFRNSYNSGIEENLSLAVVIFKQRAARVELSASAQRPIIVGPSPLSRDLCRNPIGARMWSRAVLVQERSNRPAKCMDRRVLRRFAELR